jgi:hypothetical protein
MSLKRDRLRRDCPSFMTPEETDYEEALRRIREAEETEEVEFTSSICF